MGRIVSKRRDPDKTLVSEVMTADVRDHHRQSESTAPSEIMARQKIPHLPLVDRATARLSAWSSMPALLRDRVRELSQRNRSLSFIFGETALGLTARSRRRAQRDPAERSAS